MKYTARFCFIAFTTCLSGCSNSIEPDNYFPLQTGLRWSYQVQYDLGDYGSKHILDIENIDTIKLDDITATVRRTSDGTDYYLTANEKGTFRVGKRSIVQEQIEKDTDTRMVLPYPGALQQDQSWSSVTVPYAIHRVSPLISPGNSDIRFQMTYVLAGTNDDVAVPAGNFTRCLRVEGSGQISIYADAKNGYQDIHITTTEWYAPGVGLIKLERTEPLDTDVYKGGRILMELSKFKN